MKDRIRFLRKESGLTLENFGKEIGISAPACSNIESGKTNPSNQTILAICRAFNVREEWLRYGLEPMRAPKTREEEISEMVGQVFADDSGFQKAVIRMLCSRTKDELKSLENAFLAVYENYQDEQ